MDAFVNAMKGYAAMQAGALGQPRMGTVTSYNPADGTAKVLLQPEGVLTGWLPVLSASVGNGWGLQVGLSGGQQVMVLPQDGDSEHGAIIGRAHSDVDRPPGAPGDEFWIVHKSGSFVKLTDDGKLTMQDASGTSLAFANNGTVTLTGNLVVTGDITDRNRTTGDATLNQFREAYDAHKHTGIQPGSASTDTTDTPV